MHWTVETFWTMGNDALDSWERRRPGGTAWRQRCGEDSRTHEAWSHGLDRGDFLDHGE
ncbi:hypothetical protein J3R75_001788 [Oligosphaera ethanolica]|uniref:Uncharacterized protein n=1 Tax=Oligosphaera ethanolica TaxID=760260 RepID=A0AAE3VFY4_9BACT|nr:hypothetical protein [Oligosphaera ethanolica]